MEENDEIYVMADTNSPQLTPIKAKRKISWIILGSLGAVITIFGVILAYVLINKKPHRVGNGPPYTPSPTTSPTNSPVPPENLEEKLTVHFPFNSAEIKPADISQIECLWSKAKDGKGKVMIAGHADDLGTQEYNEELSLKRAKKIVKILQVLSIKKHYKITIEGFGERKPVAKNTTEQGRALNRRVEIFFNIQK